MRAHGEIASPAAIALQRIADFTALTKPRLNSMAVFAVAVGWWAEAGALGDVRVFLFTLAGAALVAGGASALNQLIERRQDALMERTRDRPLPAGRLTPVDAAVFGGALSIAGLAILLLAANPLAAGVGAATLVFYVFVYTPLKTRTSLNTLVGAIPGALPPVIGAAAATGAIGPRAGFLFALIAMWQLPHFLSIAWLYRRDYERAGYAMLPVVTRESGATGRQVVLQGFLTIAVSLAAAPLGFAGTGYVVVAALAGAALLVAGVRFAARSNDERARVLLRVSLVYLPVVLAAFALDA